MLTAMTATQETVVACAFLAGKVCEVKIRPHDVLTQFSTVYGLNIPPQVRLWHPSRCPADAIARITQSTRPKCLSASC